jgi:uncharacterized membrane protein YgaE (UPF0421/DUF939 family)
MKKIIDNYAFINSLKATLACLIGLVLARDIFHFAQPQWVLISIIIVMAAQYRLGGAILKGYARLFATAIGSSFGSAILFFFPTHPLIIYITAFTLITLFIYLSSRSKDYAYAYSIGAVTIVIIVISDHPQLKYAFNRFFEIMLGVSLGILVSRFIFPIHAEKILYKNISNTLKKLNRVYRLFIQENKIFGLDPSEKSLEEDIFKNFTDQIVLLKEACTESQIVRKLHLKYLLFLRLERRLLRGIYMLHYTLRMSLTSFSKILKMQEFKLLHHEINLTIENLAEKIKDKNKPLIYLNLDETYRTIISNLMTILDQYSFDEKNKIHAFIFCLGHVIWVLKRMQKILSEISS